MKKYKGFVKIFTKFLKKKKLIMPCFDVLIWRLAAGVFKYL